MTWKDKANAIIDDAVKDMKRYVRTDNLGSAISKAGELQRDLGLIPKDKKTESTIKLMKMLETK